MKIYLAGAVVLVVLCFMFRWDVIPLQSSGGQLPSAYKLNRITGEVVLLYGATKRDIANSTGQ